jgi:hypothetical protein
MSFDWRTLQDDDRSQHTPRWVALPLVEPADEMEQELPAGLSEGEITEFVEDDEVHARQLISEPTLPSVAGLGLEPVDQIDHIVESAAGAGTDAASGDGDSKASGGESK